MTHQSPALTELQQFRALKLRLSAAGKKRWKGTTEAQRSAIAKAARSHGKQKGVK